MSCTTLSEGRKDRYDGSRARTDPLHRDDGTEKRKKTTRYPGSKRSVTRHSTVYVYAFFFSCGEKNFVWKMEQKAVFVFSADLTEGEMWLYPPLHLLSMQILEGDRNQNPLFLPSFFLRACVCLLRQFRLLVCVINTAISSFLSFIFFLFSVCVCSVGWYHRDYSWWFQTSEFRWTRVSASAEI